MEILASQFRNIVVLTGAGMSAESGLKTFRDKNGLWENHRVEDVATPEAFAKNPKLVHKFYNDRRSQLLEAAQPNLAHSALAQFEKLHQGNFLIVTQNIDDLHERGGSKNVVHMHGELLKSRCLHCENISDCSTPLSLDSACAKCKNGKLRPHIVWFGEFPLFMDEIHEAIQECDLFVSIGTSGNVYPAAGFVQVAKQYGATTVELNLEESMISSDFEYRQNGKASVLVSKFFATQTI